MFTGLIKEKGIVAAVKDGAGSRRLSLDAPGIGASAAVGDSFSVDGACLTVAEKKGSRLTFDISNESLRRTTLGQLRPGSIVNLEDSLRLGDALGGHFVLGHVDGTAAITAVRRGTDSVLMSLRVPSALARYLVPKGSIAVDGISLTVNEVRGNVFNVTLIPHTLSRVTLGSKKAGDRVNIEADILVKTVARIVENAGAAPPGRR